MIDVMKQAEVCVDQDIDAVAIAIFLQRFETSEALLREQITRSAPNFSYNEYYLLLRLMELEVRLERSHGSVQEFCAELSSMTQLSPVEVELIEVAAHYFY
ncbi:MAG: hypothetical protein OXT67_04215, partial [Zetaproteobacteria bacterium]|nr:hypothetical protein [Zetaproteobacteria bacterium]